MSELPASRIEYSTYVHMRMAARDDLVVLQFERVSGMGKKTGGDL